MLKKIKVLSIVVCLLLAMTSFSASAAFSDLEAGADALVIERWNEAGLVSGCGDNNFCPDREVTKAELAKIISDLFVLKGENAEFADVIEDAWYYNYVQNAAQYMPCHQEGAEADCNHNFEPQETVTKAETLEILSGLTKVPEDTKANAEGNLTRAELVLMIDEILGGELGFEYMLSVIDAHNIDEEEVMPLVALVPDSKDATFNDKGQVLLLSWHKYPDSYVHGEQFTCAYGEMWTFTDKEVLSWYDENNEGVTDWELRFEQLLGLPATDAKTHVSAFWVDMDEIIRPAYLTDATAQIDPNSLDGSLLGEHKEWFDGNAEYSYNTSAYPWTRLGYTYDWSKDTNEYGLTEFIILPDSVIDVEWTKSFDEFLAWLAEN